MASTRGSVGGPGLRGQGGTELFRELAPGEERYADEGIATVTSASTAPVLVINPANAPTPAYAPGNARPFRFVIMSITVDVNGATIWASTGPLIIEESVSGTDLVSIPVSGLIANARATETYCQGATPPTRPGADLLRNGLTAGNGVQVQHATAGTGSDAIVQVRGYWTNRP